jgi:glutamyl-tRNA reductase
VSGLHLVLVGLSHHQAPIEVRERVSCSPHALPDALSTLASRPGAKEAVLLSTCNRTEVYAMVESSDIDAAYALLRTHLAQFHTIPESDFAPYLYQKAEHDAALHLLRVASGLDSLVLGEAQILGQVRGALRAAQKAGTTRHALTLLFQQALAAGKRVRTETQLGRGEYSIGHAAVDLAASIFEDLSRAVILILGAGKMSELTARHLVNSGVRFVVVANRTYQKAEEMAARLGGKAIQYDTFAEAMVSADIVISSTAAPHPILRREMLAPIQRRRRGKPLILIDIAVPRDIDPDVSGLDDVILYNIDHLQEAAAAATQGRTAESLAQAEVIVTEEIGKFLTRYRSRQVTPVIAELRTHLEKLAEQRLEILRARLGPLPEREWQAIATQMRSLAQEIALEPTLRLKREAGEERDETYYDLMTAVRELFGLRSESAAESWPDSAPAEDAVPDDILASGDAYPPDSLSEDTEALRNTAEVFP